MYLLTFFDSRWTLKYIIEEAKQFDFERIFAWTEKDLDNEFWDKHQKFIKNNLKGFGYWIWKPQIIEQALEKIPQDSCLLYVDGGCSLNVKGKSRLYEYEILARESEGVNILAFSGLDAMEKWTKKDTFDFIGGDEKKKQLAGGCQIYINTVQVKSFVKEWLSICEKDNYHYLDNTPSNSKNFSEFTEHRHEQSIFTLLAYKYKSKVIPQEFLPPKDNNEILNLDWKKLENYPIHVKRRRVFISWIAMISYVLKYLKINGFLNTLSVIYRTILRKINLIIKK